MESKEAAEGGSPSKSQFRSTTLTFPSSVVARTLPSVDAAQLQVVNFAHAESLHGLHQLPGPFYRLTFPSVAAASPSSSMTPLMPAQRLTSQHLRAFQSCWTSALFEETRKRMMPHLGSSASWEQSIIHTAQMQSQPMQAAFEHGSCESSKSDRRDQILTGRKKAKECSEGSLSTSEKQSTLVKSISSLESVPGLRGEQRLSIRFKSFGTHGKTVETYGKNNTFIIPSGLSGEHFAYGQPWRFEIHHGDTRDDCSGVRVIWKITNLTTMQTLERMETVEESKRRHQRGWTISNEVFREAMEKRVQDLERNIPQETNPTRIASIQSLIKSLKPKKFSEGLLVFGLQHKVVQVMIRQSLSPEG